MGTPPRGALDDVLRVHHLQLEATHNSYHRRPTTVIPNWDYDHAPLDEQLDRQGVRGLELDLHWNVACARYEVYHVGRLDDRTTCRVFTECLSVIRRWSDAHPAHHPLLLHIEHKTSFAREVLEDRLAAMEREMLSVWPRALIVTPDDVRGDATTLAEALRTRGWPTLASTRGKVIFYLDNTDALRDVYTHGGRDLNERVAFVDSAPTDPFAGVAVINDASRTAQIATALRAGMLVRVFSWAAGSNGPDLSPETSPERVAMTGAHIISTDYPAMAPNVMRWVELAGGTPSRCNPVTAPMACTAMAIESLPTP
jgi:hypothetical protein